MLLTIDFASSEPIYMQIRNHIVLDIATGAFHDGDVLPSVRTLGAELGVNLHTVRKAYKLLESEGFLEILRSHETVIHAGDAARNAARFLKSAGASLRGIVSEAITRKVDRSVLHRMIDGIYDDIGGKKP